MVVHWNHWCTSPGFEFCKQYTGFRLWRPHFKYRSSLKEVRRISKNCPILSYKHIFSKCFFIQSPFFIFNSGPWALTELYLPWPVPTNKVRHHQLYYTYRDQQEYRNEMWWFTDTTKWEIGLFFTSCFSFIMTSMLIFKFCFLLAWIYLTFLTLFAPIALSKKFLHHITIAEF